MNIPKRIRIGGVDYWVLDNQYALNDGQHLLYGQIDYTTSEIKIADAAKSPEMKGITLWHEILHGIRNHAGLDIEDEENVVDMFAKGIFQVLEDNIDRLYSFGCDTNAP